MNWLKRNFRGSLLHRLLNRWTGREGSTRASDSDLNMSYDQQTIEVMRRVLRRDSNCVDIGAHKGDILRHIVEIAPGGSHHAFEALPPFAEELRQRFRGVTIHQVAVSDRNGQSEFQYVENDPAYSGLCRRVYDRPDPTITVIPVTLTTLDEAIPGEQPIAFIKIDIEGGEYHALKGAEKTIRRWRPVIVFEAGIKSTGQYGVTPDAMFTLICSSFDYDLSTMRRWLDRRPPYTPEEFRRNWHGGPDFYFIATAKGEAR